MDKTIVIIFGSTGMLGNYCARYICNFIEVLPVTRNSYDINTNNTMALDNLIKNIAIKYYCYKKIVINCAGLIPHRKNTDIEMINVNSIFPLILNRLCRKYNLHLIHISTDCVFNGTRGNYNELDEPDEKNMYGLSKFWGEGENMMIIRTSIIGEEMLNKLSLLEWLKSNRDKTVNGYTNHYWNGVTCLELARQITDIIIQNRNWIGVRHMFSPEIVTKSTLLKLLNNAYKLNVKINDVETTKIDKTLSTIYTGFFKITSLYEQIKQLKNLNFYPNN